MGTKKFGKQVTCDCFHKNLRKIAKRTGIKKRVNPHNFRHSRATDLANHITDAQMKQYFGWTRNSQMASVYIHLSGRDIEEAILKIHGKIDGAARTVEDKDMSHM